MFAGREYMHSIQGCPGNQMLVPHAGKQNLAPGTPLRSPSPLVFAGSVSANLLCIKRTIYASFGCNLAVERKSNAALPVVSMARNVVSLRSSVIAFQLSLFCENLHGTLDHIEARNL